MHRKHCHGRGWSKVAARALVLGSILAAGPASAAGEDLAAAPGRTFNPGHYVALDMWDDGPDAIRDVLRDGVQGVQKRYAWRDLEVRENVYDLSEIARDLEVVREAGRQLVVFVFDKSFRDERFTPEYLWEAHTLPVRSATPGKGYVAKRWDPYVVARMGALLEEIGRRFDDDPHFEGVAIQESAIGVVDEILDREGYTAVRYRDSIVETLRNARTALPTSQVFWYMNYLARGQELQRSVLAAARPLGIVVGGPDVLPDHVPLRRHVYPLLRAHQDMTLFISAQNDSFRHVRAAGGEGRYWTPHEIFEYARDELHVRYLFWNRVNQPRPPDSYCIDSAYTVMAAHPRIGEGRDGAR